MLTLGYFIYKDLVYDRWRSLLTVSGIAVTVLAYLLLSSFAQAFLVFNAKSQVTSNLVIVASDVIDPMESSLDESVLQTAQQVAPDQIVEVFPTLFRHLNIEDQIMQIRAVPMEQMPAALALRLVQGSWPEGAQEVVVSQGVARIAAWKTGSVVNIYGTNFRVVGLVSSGENNSGAVWMTYSAGQRLFGMRRGFQVGYLRLRPSADPESVRALLQADPRIADHYTVYLENALGSNYYQVNHNLLTLNSIMGLVALLAITFGAYNATNLSLTERGHEIGLLRVVGFTQGKLRIFLLARTLVLTLVSYGLGWIAAIVFINYHRAHTAMGVSAAPLVLNLTPSASLLGLALAIVFSFLGVWLTSGRLALLSPLTGSD
jgi:ABC-type antimicrobial peptide transport system permease subunit